MDDLYLVSAAPASERDPRAARQVRFRIDLHRLVLEHLRKRAEHAPQEQKEHARTTLISYASRCRMALDALAQTVIPSAMPPEHYLRAQREELDRVLRTYG